MNHARQFDEAQVKQVCLQHHPVTQKVTVCIMYTAEPPIICCCWLALFECHSERQMHRETVEFYYSSEKQTSH